MSVRRDVVLTDREGRTFDPPRRVDFRSEDDYLDAYDDYRRRISDAMTSRGVQLGLERDRDSRRLTTAERNRLPARVFALPKRRALPIPDAAHTRNAAARLEQMRIRGTVSPTEYHEARARILQADAHFGIEPRERASARDPDNGPIQGAVYLVEWETVDGESGQDEYVYEGVYPASGADMYRRVAGSPSQRTTIYLFPHEVRYRELLGLPRAKRVPPAPGSAPRRRLGVPELRPGRALMRPARAMPRVWDLAIVGPGVARAAQFQGIRRIDDALFYIWNANGTLYAQPRMR